MGDTSNLVFNISSGIWLDLDSPTSLAVTTISGRLISSGFLGQLDSLLQSAHYIDSGYNIVPSLVAEEQFIYSELYKCNYYRTAAIQVIVNSAGLSDTSTLFTRVREGDSEIVRESPVNVSRMLRDLEKQSWDKIRAMAVEYKKGLAIPLSVSYYGMDLANPTYPVFAPGPARAYYT